MNKIDLLIHKLCPNGVPFFYLSELEDSKRITLGRGMIISKTEMNSNPGPYPVYSSSATNNGCIGTYGKYMFDDERLTWSIDGGGRFFYRNNEKYSVTNVGGWLKVNDKTISTRYLYHVLSKEWSKKTFDYVHKAHPSVIREEYCIPVPPLEVQCEIVRILDNFTELTAELSAELTVRKQQFEYYRETLLDIDGASYCSLTKHYPFVRNGFVGTVTNSFTDEDKGVRYLEGTNIHNGIISDNEVLFVTKEFHLKHIKNELKADDVLMVQSGHIGDCAVVGEKYKGSNCHALIIMSNGGSYNSKFLVHYFHTKKGLKSLKPAITDGNLKHVLAGKMDFVKIPDIDLVTQNRIVDLLDNFETYCSDISQGLPAEISARQKQYEFYRDKLLTFKELEA